MELKKFVSQALQDIVDGVSDAQISLGLRGQHVNPQRSNSGPSSMLGKTSVGGLTIQEVMFDVAVTAVEKEGSKGGIGVLAGAFNLGAQAQASTENAAVSRIKFTVPITLPYAEKG